MQRHTEIVSFPTGAEMRDRIVSPGSAIELVHVCVRWWIPKHVGHEVVPRVELIGDHGEAIAERQSIIAHDVAREGIAVVQAIETSREVRERGIDKWGRL